MRKWGMPLVLLAGCAPQSVTEATSWTLRCTGQEQIETVSEDKSSVKRAGSEHSFFLRWNAETRSLTTEAMGVDPTAFCLDDGQEQCKVSFANGHLVADSVDLMPAKVEHGVNGFIEHYDVDLATLKGNSLVESNIGTLSDTDATIHRRDIVRNSFICVRQ